MQNLLSLCATKVEKCASFRPQIKYLYLSALHWLALITAKKEEESPLLFAASPLARQLL